MTRAALVCTQGFADALTLGRQNRSDPYALHVPASPWLQWMPAAMRLEVAGRIDAGGHEVETLQPGDLVARLRSLPQPPEAIAVCLLFAHLNPAHEKALKALLQAAFPGVRVACSHEVFPQAGEYERTVAVLESLGVRLPAAPPPAPGAGFSSRLEDLADRMQATLVAKAVSSVVREAMDCAAAVFLPDGRMVAQARSLPLLLGSLSPAVAGLLQAFPVERMEEGDVFLSNDPWSGGTHLPDFVLLRPVLQSGRVQALAACILHHQDVGGITPGSVPTDATSIHQEGLRIPPVQLARHGQTDGRLLDLLRANSRMPDNLAGDLQAQCDALEGGAQELQALIAAMGAGFRSESEATIAQTEAAVRAALAAAPDGEWIFRDALDGDGLSAGLVPISAVLRKRGNELEIDLTGCAPQTRGPINASRGAAWAAISYFARMLAPGAPSNHGCTAPLRVLTTPGTVVDPAFPAAVNARTNLVKLLANALLGAWAQAAPERTPAPNAGVAVVLSLSGTRDGGARWLYTEIIASAAGGAPTGPGGSGQSTDVGNARSTPAEVIEAQAPIRVERVALRPGSGGKGRHAGGDGVMRTYRLLEGSGLVSYRGERHQTQAQGAAGGEPGACGGARIERADGTVEHLPAKARVAWRAGDRLVIETAGGGGWGKPVPPGLEFA